MRDCEENYVCCTGKRTARTDRPWPSGVQESLSEADGDIDAAIEALRKSSGMKAAKKAGRTAADGVVAIQTADDGSFAAMVEVNSETDFVARDENFLCFVQSVVGKAFGERIADVERLAAGDTEDARQALVQKIGENISVRRVVTHEASEGVREWLRPRQ